jgi:hypothetical protein
MKLLIAALALLSFVATSALPDAVVAQTSTDQTQTAPAGTMSAPKTTHHKHTKAKKKPSTKKHHKKKPVKKHTTHKKKHKTKKPATSTNPS